jgi:hypothetical protein
VRFLDRVWIRSFAGVPLTLRFMPDFESRTMKSMRRWTTLLCAVAAVTTLGCGDIVCAGPGAPAMQVRVLDGSTGAVISDATVTARYFIGGEGDAQIYMRANSRGEIVPTIDGTFGLYEVTVRKAGYSDVVQRVTVPGTSGPCPEAITVDLTLHLFPIR